VIFSGSTKSTWSFTKNGASLGTIHLFTTGGQGPVRAELVNLPHANVIMIGREGKVWLREEERDIDFATLRFKGINFANSTLPLLMLPHLTHAGAALELTGEMVYRYIGRFGWGLYQKDANRTPKKIEVSAHQIDLLLERLTVEDATHDPSIFNLRT
jgi:hypothetical protein